MFKHIIIIPVVELLKKSVEKTIYNYLIKK